MYLDSFDHLLDNFDLNALRFDLLLPLANDLLILQPESPHLVLAVSDLVLQLLVLHLKTRLDLALELFDVEVSLLQGLSELLQSLVLIIQSLVELTLFVLQCLD